MERQDWKSARKIEEEVKLYRAKRFEDYMQLVDAGEMELAIACTALREEIMFADSPQTSLHKSGQAA